MHHFILQEKAGFDQEMSEARKWLLGE